ncbi:hypothetical protein PHYSODRAFT_446266, partial [Phytophthora sojae]
RQKWLPKYEKELGVRPFSCSGTEVIEALCKFCESFGREDEEDKAQPRAGFVATLGQKKQRKKPSGWKIDTKFNALLESHESKLNEHFGEATTQEIWAQRKKLIHIYKTKTDVRRSIDDASDEPFGDAW